MPAVTVSAVNTGTDTLTATAHGLLTGDRCRVRNVGGALPTGLTATVDVFAVRVDADNLQLADTNAHALAGTPVLDITGAGSGTTTIEYGLPYCVPRVMAVGSQLFSADLNGSWGSLVALYGLLTGQAQSVWSEVNLAVALKLAALKLVTSPPAQRALLRVGSDGTVDSTQHKLTVSAANAQLTSIGLASVATFDGSVWNLSTSGGGQGPVFDCPLISGLAVTAVKAYVAKSSASGTITATFRIRDLTTGTIVRSGNATLATSNPGNVTMALTTMTVGVLPFTVPDAHGITITVDGGGVNGDTVKGVTVEF